MKCTVSNRRLLANVFHDVDLATIGPADGINVVSQHPKCGPDSLSERNSKARFKPPVHLRELLLGEESCRGLAARYVVGASVVFLYGRYNQDTFFQPCVNRSIRVGLKLVVAPTPTADIKGPLGGVHRRTRWPIEFVTPR